mmetsp:Transcript_32059/g.79912  ORF Transcript_32059/g.79912 Transcript_32059/m.79912 type:complete len:202 (+) Transcript_32059:358-963(+)
MATPDASLAEPDALGVALAATSDAWCTATVVALEWKLARGDLGGAAACSEAACRAEKQLRAATERAKLLCTLCMGAEEQAAEAAAAADDNDSEYEVEDDLAVAVARHLSRGDAAHTMLAFAEEHQRLLLARARWLDESAAYDEATDADFSSVQSENDDDGDGGGSLSEATELTSNTDADVSGSDIDPAVLPRGRSVAVWLG